MTEEQGVIQETHPLFGIEESPSMSAEIEKLATALSKAQGEIEFAAKTSENTFFKSKYADLAEVWKAARKPLEKNGLAVVQLTNGGPILVTVTTLLTHSSGQWMRSDLTVRPVPKYDKELKKAKDITPQDLGSAITYGRRYAMAAIVGITQDDDDGNGASGKTTNVETTVQKPARKSQAAPKPPAATSAVVVPEGELVIKAVPEFYKAKDGKKPHSVKLAGDWYTTFSDTAGEALEEAFDSGQPITINYVMKGDYRNITSVDAPPADPVTPAGQMADPNAVDDEPPIGDDDIPF